MDQIRIGAFLKALRKEKGLTQEQLAEKLAVSGRTVSRWETGSNMPDIGMLVVLADFYGVSIPELINGERKSENMNQETRDTAIAMAEYSQVTAKSSRRKVIGILFITFGLFKGRRREAPEGSFWDRLQLFQNDGSVTAPPTQGSLREPFRICHNRLFQYAKTPGHWTGGLLALWLPCGEGQGGRS